VTFKAEGLPGDTKHSHCYNIRVDWELGLACVAMMRIPCACEACLEQLKQPWDAKLEHENLPQYAKGSKECELWPIFEGLNDWHLVELSRVPAKIAALEKLAQEELFEAQNTILNGILAKEMAEGIEVGKIGAFSTEDNKTSGYYLVQWKSEAYTLQDDTILTTEFDPPLELEAAR
jgi:hypothetical protein